MTIHLTPNQERAIQEAIRAGRVGSVEELIDRALTGLPARSESDVALVTAAEQGLGLFGSPEEASLLDEIVRRAYAERGRPSQRTPLF